VTDAGYDSPVTDHMGYENRCQFHQHFTAAFTPADPKSAKYTVKSSVFFMLLGSALVKAERKHVGEIDPRYFLYVTPLMTDTAPGPIKTILTSPLLSGEEHPVECLKFWFNLKV